MALPMKQSPARKSKSLLISMLIILVVFAEIAFLSRLDMAKNAAIVHTWTKSFITASVVGFSSDSLMAESEDLEELGVDSCEDWLKREDLVSYDRDFNEDPIWVSGAEKEWRSCAVGCNFGSDTKPDKRPDAVFGLGHDSTALNVLRSMESSHYYSDNNIDHARRKGFHIVMTTSLSSDVPVGYFSWAEYDIMSPVQPKTEEALAAAFISNCGARNFRLEALTMLENMKIKIDSYGACHRNRDGRAVDKVETLKKYKFSLAFENSNEEDYVTEKFFQSLVSGSVPVVVGAPNILDFAPSPVSVLHIKSLDDVHSVGKRMLDLSSNPQAYNESVRWKYDGPSDSFKALVDMAAVHSSCRLCIHLATLIQDKEEKSNPTYQKRPCKCVRGGETIYHLFLRERGRFELKSIFLRSSNLTLAALTSEVYTKFKSENHVPVWKNERPEVLRGGNWKVYKIYPVGLTQRQALYNFKFDGDGSLREYVESRPCSKLEVVFV